MWESVFLWEIAFLRACAIILRGLFHTTLEIQIYYDNLLKHNHARVSIQPQPRKFNTYIQAHTLQS